jgi:hypothetical protein
MLKINDMLYFSKKWLNGGLYNAMAFEGPGNTTEKVNDLIRRLERAKEMVSQELATESQSA